MPLDPDCDSVGYEKGVREEKVRVEVTDLLSSFLGEETSLTHIRRVCGELLMDIMDISSHERISVVASLKFNGKPITSYIEGGQKNLVRTLSITLGPQEISVPN